MQIDFLRYIDQLSVIILISLIFRYVKWFRMFWENKFRDQMKVCQVKYLKVYLMFYLKEKEVVAKNESLSEGFILIRISKCSRAECSIDSLDSTSSTLDCISFQS